MEAGEKLEGHCGGEAGRRLGVGRPGCCLCSCFLGPTSMPPTQCDTPVLTTGGETYPSPLMPLL